MSPLTDRQRAAVIELLEDREQSLESMVNTHVGRLRDSSDPDEVAPAGDIADLAEIELVREQENAAVSRDMRELREIEAARERLAAEEAGVCIDCGEPIGFERLMALPTASRCVACQAIHEQTQTHPQTSDASVGGI